MWDRRSCAGKSRVLDQYLLIATLSSSLFIKLKTTLRGSVLFIAITIKPDADNDAAKPRSEVS
jgi:hypothetical protein